MASSSTSTSGATSPPFFTQATTTFANKKNIIAAAQMTSTSDIARNQRIIRRLTIESRDRGAVMLFLPECFHFMGDSTISSTDIAQPLQTSSTPPPSFSSSSSSTSATNHTTQTMANPLLYYQLLAREFGMWLSLGGYPERTTVPITPNVESDTVGSTPTTTKFKVHNAHIIIDANGTVYDPPYRKLHLFDIGGPGVPTMKESAFTEPGNDLVCVDTPVGRVGLSVCYDLRFSEFFAAFRGGRRKGKRDVKVAQPSSSLRLNESSVESSKDGATSIEINPNIAKTNQQQQQQQQQPDIIAIPAAFTVPTGEAHWEVLLRARAIETQSYIVAAAQVGKHNVSPGRWSYGHSLIIDPWGKILAEAAGNTVDNKKKTQKSSERDAPVADIEGGKNAVGSGDNKIENNNVEEEEEDCGCIITAEIDLDYLASIRQKIPVSSHAREDVY